MAFSPSTSFEGRLERMWWSSHDIISPAVDCSGCAKQGCKQTKHGGGQRREPGGDCHGRREVIIRQSGCKWNFTQSCRRGNLITLLVAGLVECVTKALRRGAEWLVGGQHHTCPNPPSPTSWILPGALCHLLGAQSSLWCHTGQLHCEKHWEPHKATSISIHVASVILALECQISPVPS